MLLQLLLCLLALFFPGLAAAEESGGCCPHGKLKVSGTQLLGSDNQPVQLRGMSLFWSNFPEGSPFFNEQTVQCLKCNWHADIVRAPMGVEEAGGNKGYLADPATEMAKEEAVIDAAIKNCMYVLVDWHYTSATAYPDKAEEFFKKMAAKCAGKCNCLYETWNEPTQVDWSSTLKPYHEKVIAAIREQDKDGVVIAGTPTWDQDVDKAADDPIKDKTNVMYTLHFYAGEGSHKQPLRDKAAAAIKKGLPLFVTEYGTTPASGDGTPDLAETQKWYDFLDENKVSYINWSISNKGEQSSALQEKTGPADVCKDDKDTTSGAFVKKMLRAKQPALPQGCAAPAA
uniref:Beta-1,4-endoglucanase n=1 Tax=Pratylenchus goodeyi TaxID=344392 RepID=A0A0B4V198_9BILA|nr:beta-1,4-endoglucanase [Pratylenchus goodeyi]